MSYEDMTSVLSLIERPGNCFPTPGMEYSLHSIDNLPRSLVAAVVLWISFVVVVLLYNIHGKHLRSCRDGQLT